MATTTTYNDVVFTTGSHADKRPFGDKCNLQGIAAILIKQLLDSYGFEYKIVNAENPRYLCYVYFMINGTYTCLVSISGTSNIASLKNLITEKLRSLKCLPQ